MSSAVPISGHVFRREGARGPVWYAKYRLPDGRQVQRKIGPAWRERGRPAAGFFTKRTAEAWLADVLGEAPRGELPGMVSRFGGERPYEHPHPAEDPHRPPRRHGARKAHLEVPRNPISDVEKPVQRKSTEIPVFSTEEVMALVRVADSDQDAASFLTAAFTGLRRGALVAPRWRNVDFPRRHLRVTASYTERALSTPEVGEG